MTLTFFFSMFCSLSSISLSWKTLVFGRFTSQERTNVHRTAFLRHTPDFSLSKVTALKVVWGKDSSRHSKEPGTDLPSCFSAWAPFCKCGWRHHISRSGCGPHCFNFLILIFFWKTFFTHDIYPHRIPTTHDLYPLPTTFRFVILNKVEVAWYSFFVATPWICYTKQIKLYYMILFFGR